MSAEGTVQSDSNVGTVAAGERPPTPDSVKNLIFDYATEQGRGNVLWPLRVALSGKDKSPDPFTLCSILGKTETLSRISNAIFCL